MDETYELCWALDALEHAQNAVDDLLPDKEADPFA
jgi:hypothetical protein